MKWVDKHIEVDPPKKPKKLTGTRFGAVLGVNRWSTDFEVWCAVTRTYEEPFEDTIYTLAGKAIESKQIEYMKNAYVMDNLKTPTDIYGADYFKKTYGDFFGDTPIFGGMWDSLLFEDGKPDTVLEFKTTKRSEDWKNDVPEYYALQAALYAYLLGVDDVIMICSFLEDDDYKAPEKFVPTAKNTITVEFKVSERYPDFKEKIEIAKKWWSDHVLTGISPDFDEKKDAEILKALRTNNLNPETDIAALLAEVDTLQDEINKHDALIKDKTKRLDALKKQLKEYATSQFREGDKSVTLSGSRYVWTLAKSVSTKVDDKALKEAGLYEKFSKTETTYRFTNKEINSKED